MFNKIKGIIFDMDGTLIDSMGMWSSSGDTYLKLKDIKNTRSFKLVRHDRNYNDLTLEFMQYYNLDMDLYDLKKEFEDMVEVEYREKLKLKNNVREFLEMCSGKGIRMSVATATNSSLAKMCFERLDILKYFDIVLSTKDIGINKFSPDVYLRCAEAMGTTVEDTAVFEDAIYAATTAKNAGFKTVGIYDEEFKDGFEQLKTLVDIAILDYSELFS